jgi:hypothetical protein
MVSQLSARTIEQITSPRVRRLHEYWRSKRLPGQPFAFRKDIDPTDLRDLLALITILDVEHAPLRFRYRLVGTRVVEYNHQEFTGQYLGEVGWQDEAMLLGAYEQSVVERRPSCGFYAWDLRSGGIGRCEFGIFPLTNDGETIHQIISIEDYEFPAREVDPDRV